MGYQNYKTKGVDLFFTEENKSIPFQQTGLKDQPKINELASKMFTIDKNKIQEYWLEEIYPRQNSITFNNGFYCFFEHSAKEEKLTKKKIWIPANDFLLNHTDICEGLSTIYTAEGSNNNSFTCGECLASGDDGFIALSKKDTGELVWLIVLSGTNPFEKIIIHNSSIHVQSSSGTLAIVPTDRPDNLSIEWS